jgi:hypothetical protein
MVTRRTFNILDWIANVCGIVVGGGILMMVQRLKGKMA